MTESRFSGILNEQIDVALKAYPHYEKMRKELARIVQFYHDSADTGGIPYELGCGSGETTRHVLKEILAPIIVIDNDKEMLHKMRKKFDQEGIDPIRVGLILDDADHALERIANSGSFPPVSVVYSSWVLHNFDKDYRRSVIEKSYGLINPGGAFISLDKYALDDVVEDEKLYRSQADRIIETLSQHPVLRDKLLQHEYEDTLPEFIMRESESMDLMKETGFKNCRIAMRVGRDAILVAEK